ncbi:PHD finger protein rhinoceros [Aplysia californica]|uniref:PHD finger protein rhinoceros n=1 Tax=Aplysia californica TaxID=6500 RepID=A0ABM1A9Q9_APLCA|nr:PHD finger protein rhinoceros [Aplysia californica]
MPLSKSSKRVVGGREDSPEPGPSCRDKESSDEEEDPMPRKGKAYSSSKMSKQGKNKKNPAFVSKQNAGTPSHNKPAELFRKDLISAMKLADTEILYEGEYVVISDPWRQEWEKGVQVPVNEEEIPPLSIQDIRPKEKNGDFKIPPRKYLHEKSDETYVSVLHELTGMQEVAEHIVRYDLDDQDVTWLQLVNEDREEMGLQLINEWNLERMIEELENQCYAKTNAVKKTEEGLGIEYDEDIACDVCRMLESEDTNEMVFCDGCDICVHQACYGIQTIPEGSWLCRICALGIKPMCLLCPKRGGAMKSTRSGTKWTHVSCALWIPEVSIGDPEKMEPITKISNIPPSRWALVCCLCKERVGACIQCSVKQCKTAFHVTCGFAHNLDMKTILDDTDEMDGIHLRAYCPKHTKNRNASDSESPKKEEEEEENADNENDISEAEMARQRMEKLQQLEEEFYRLVDTEEIAAKFFIPEEAVDVVTQYWKLKRKVNNNKALITPKMEEEDQMQKQQKDSLSARMKMFVHLRQDLERARNLCYMISKREKTKKQFFKLKESVFRSQVRVLTDSELNLSAREAEGVRQAYQFGSIYSNYGVASELCSKMPRENLFTLENLKTPKDFVESGEEGGGETSRRSSSASKSSSSLLHGSKFLKAGRAGRRSKSKSGDSLVAESTTAGSAAGGGGGGNEAEEVNRGQQAHRQNLFSMDRFGLVSDSNADTSEDEVPAAGRYSRTDSRQMSRLGKVKPEEVVEETLISVVDDDDDALPEGKPDGEEVVTPKKFVPGDLKKRLTSILQSKTMMQQKQGRSSAGVGGELDDPLSRKLHVDVNHSDSEVFTSDTNTDLFSPAAADQQRNLFDQFRVKAKPPMSSPDTPAELEQAPADAVVSTRPPHKRLKKRRHGRSPHKHKRARRDVLSPSEQSTGSSVSVKQEVLSSTEGDSGSLTSRCEQVLNNDGSADLNRSPPSSLVSPVIEVEATTSDLSPKLSSPPRSSKDRRKKSRRAAGSSSAPNIISPSPRVHPSEAFATMDGDIYVPSGKIQVTERTIVLDDPKEEEKSPVRSKLRLKKQANSPVKGVVSYEVVKEEEDKHDVVRSSDLEEASKNGSSNNVFERILVDSVDVKKEVVEKSEQEAVLVVADGSEERSLRRHRKGEDSRVVGDSVLVKKEEEKKLEPSPETNTSIDIKTVKCEKGVDSVTEEKVKTDVSNLRHRRSGKRRRLRPSGQVAAATEEQDNLAGNSSDENFVPSASVAQTRSTERTPRPRRSLTTRRTHPDMVKADDSDDFAESPSSSPRKSASNNNHHTSGGGRGGSNVQLKPFHNRPELDILLDSRKLVVKEPLKRQVSAKLGQLLKCRGRWSSGSLVNGKGQTTLDKFVTRRNSSENVFARADSGNSSKLGGGKRGSQAVASRTDLLHPLQTNSSTNHSDNVLSKQQDSNPGALVKSSSVFGAHSSPRGSLSSYRIPRKSDAEAQSKDRAEGQGVKASEPDVFGDTHRLHNQQRLSRQLSFEDVRDSTDLEEVVKTPSKCDPAQLSEDRLDGGRGYRSHSPASSDASGVSTRVLHASRDNTPRRMTRSQIAEDSPSPNTRLLRRREGAVLKPPQLKLS